MERLSRFLSPGIRYSSPASGGAYLRRNAAFNISGEDAFLGGNDPADSSFTLAALAAGPAPFAAHSED